MLAIGTLAGCTTTAETSGGGGGGLPSALTARMDQQGATLDRASALALVNSYRSTVGAAPLAADAGLDATAQSLASAYASTGSAPGKPDGVVAVRSSAGYGNFAETFSGWRNSPADAAALGSRPAQRAGIASVYNPSSSYGVYWVLVLDE